jgi:hypothetical protein
MKLKAYIDGLGITPAEAARQMDKPQQRVHLWVNDLRIPRKADMNDIVKWSHGNVLPNDFYLPADDARANGHDPAPVTSEAAA